MQKVLYLSVVVTYTHGISSFWHQVSNVAHLNSSRKLLHHSCSNSTIPSMTPSQVSTRVIFVDVFGSMEFNRNDKRRVRREIQFIDSFLNMSLFGSDHFWISIDLVVLVYNSCSAYMAHHIWMPQQTSRKICLGDYRTLSL